MHEWLKISLLLCLFGFLKEIRPSEPFIYEFLIDQRWRNITEDQVTQEVYPVGTYAYLAQLVVVFLITDICRYKPLIIVCGASAIAVWSLLLWTKTLFALQVLEVLYGTFSATEVAYYTYIYAIVDREHYQLVTSHTRAAILAGRAISGIIAQILISFELMDYRELNYITLGAMIFATIWAIFLPSAKKSIYFHQDSIRHHSPSEKTKNAFDKMKDHLLTSFSNKYILKWSLWWTLSFCGYLQVQSYMQPLWAVIQTDKTETIYNGAVEAILTVLGFLGALAGGVLKIDWEMQGELAITIVGLLEGFILLYISQTESIFVSYVCYIVFGGFFHFMITIASSEIAKNIVEDGYGLVFGITTFVALIFQSILTAVVVTKNIGFALPPRDQYFVYGCFFIIVGALYIVIGLTSWFTSKKDMRKSSVAVGNTI